MECITENIQPIYYRLKGYSKESDEVRLVLAVNWMLVGKVEESFLYLNDAATKYNRYLPAYPVSPFFDNIKSDPRYDELIRKLKSDKFTSN